MLAPVWNTVLLYPLLNALVGLYRLTGDLGWSIILLTIGLRLLMTPLIMPGLRLSKKMQDIAPELTKLKQQYKNDKQGLMLAQAQLYKEHGANPASGCLPQVIQLLVLIALYSALNSVLKSDGQALVSHLNPMLYVFNQLPTDFHLSTRFFYMDLVKPDLFRIPGLPFPLPGLFVFLAAAVQFLSSKMMTPAVVAEKKVAAKTETPSDDTMVAVQQQMLYMFPLMTLVLGISFPAGLVLYWFVFSAISMFQQYVATGWGGLTPWLKQLNLIKS
jgi:YidC/Oxa1 family membrane protein insertase